MAPKVEAATSKRPSSKGRSSASASRHSMSKPSAVDCCWPNSTIRGVRSEATTRAPRLAAATARFPVPAATSSTSIPRLDPAGLHQRHGGRLERPGQFPVVPQRPHALLDVLDGLRIGHGIPLAIDQFGAFSGKALLGASRSQQDAPGRGRPGAKTIGVSGTVALSRKASAEPSQVEAFLIRRPRRRARTTRSWL